MKVIANAFLILAAGAAAYFSSVQGKKFSEQQEIRLATKSEEAKTATEATGTEKEYKDEQANLAKSTEQRDLILSGITAAKAQGTSLKRDIATIETELETQKTELAQLEKAVEELNKLLADQGGGVTIDTIGDELVKLEDAVKKKKEKMDELTTLISGAQSKIASNRAESKRLTDRATESAVRISRNAMEAMVTAVNQDWGFLVVGAGSNSGFTPQSTLLVKRDGKFIARVRPTSIEATQTIADIDLDTVAPGVRIQPGDRVILSTPAAN